MAISSYAENVKVLNLLAPQDIVATATASQYINVSQAAGTIEFMIPFGSIATSDSTGEVVVTLEASTAGSSNATEAAMAFKYRLSAAVATDNLGALTSATTAGATVGNASDNVTLFCYLEPDQLATQGADYLYVRAVITPTSDITATLIGGVHARFLSRYGGAVIPSST